MIDLENERPLSLMEAARALVQQGLLTHFSEWRVFTAEDAAVRNERFAMSGRAVIDEGDLAMATLLGVLAGRRGELTPERCLNDGMGLPEAASEKAPFRFLPSGDGYEIAGFGLSGHFKSLRGFEYLERILCGRGQPVLMSEIVCDFGASPQHFDVPQVDEDEEPPYCSQPVGRLSRQPTVDEVSQAKIEKELKSIECRREIAVETGNAEEADRLHEEQLKLAKQFAQVRGAFGHGRELGNPNDKLRSRISRALTCAYKNLREARPSLSKLAEHFRVNISACGDSFSYFANPLPDWDLG